MKPMQTMVGLVAAITGISTSCGGAAAAENPCTARWSANRGGVVSSKVEALGLDSTIESALEAMAATPGLAVGIYANGEVVYSRGFGVRDLESCAPVTPASSFYLLSVTKSFTGMAAALLQEEGVFELDQPLSHYFADFAFDPPLNADQISVRDLLNHRPGFRNGAINYRTFVPADLEGEELLRVLAEHSEPNPILFDYSNTSYIVAAMAMERASGMGWRELLEKRIFEPLGMTSSTTSMERARAGEFVDPFQESLEGRFEPAPIKFEKQMHAAGGSVSSVSDLLRWLEANLESGKVDGKQVLPARAVRQAHAPQIQYSWQYGRYRRFAYGLGVHNSDLDGELVLHHFGGPIHVSFAPERGLGMVLLSSGTQSTGFVHELAASLYDLLLDKDEARENLRQATEEARQRLDQRLERSRQREMELAARRGSLVRPAPSHAGTYVSDRLGTINVDAGGGRLRLVWGVVDVEMEPLEKDTFLVRFPWVGSEIFVFEWREGEGPASLDWGGRVFERVRETGPGGP